MVYTLATKCLIWISTSCDLYKYQPNLIYTIMSTCCDLYKYQHVVITVVSYNSTALLSDKYKYCKHVRINFSAFQTEKKNSLNSNMYSYYYEVGRYVSKCANFKIWIDSFWDKKVSFKRKIFKQKK
jgi:hypothetical protein